MHRLHSEATGISYLTGEERNAPLVICLHGFPDIPRTWSSLADELTAAGHRVVLPWLPGYAPSSLDGPFDLPSLALKIMALIDELSPVRPVRIVGHDWGSAITQVALARWPERFKAAAMLAFPHWLAFERNLERHPRQFARSAYVGLFWLPFLPDRVVPLRDFRSVEVLWRRWSPGFDPGRDYFDELKQCLRASMPAPLEYYRAMRSPRLLRASVAKGPIVVPTIYLHGERDGCIGPEIAAGQEGHFSALFETMMLSHAGHFLHLERPAEVSGAIKRWFDAH